MRKSASLTAVLLLLCAIAFAQTRTISGQVKDIKGDPVPFANISIKGTNTGVSADISGNFKIDARTGQVLVVSSTSFAEQEVTVGDSPTLTITLQPQGNLQEVVVTALGIRRTRNQLPYAAQQITGDEVNKTRTSNFVQNLSGKVSGLEIRQTNTLGGSTNVVVRGVKSFVGNNQALFVVDGVPFNNDNTNSANQTTGRGGYDYGSAAADINPDDIESITVLKGAAASALYGSRGNNGVVLITTKKSRRGLGITVNSGITVGSIDRKTFAKYQNEYGAGYGQYYEDPTGYFFYRDVDGEGTPDLITPTTEDASYGAAFDPNLMVYQWDAFDSTSPNYLKARPWMAAANGPAEFFQKQISSNQSIFIDGASDKGSFKLGYTRNDDRGILPNSSIKKNLVNFGGTYNITGNLTAGATINYANIEGKGRYGTGYDNNNVATNFRQWWETNVDIKGQQDAYNRTHRNTTWNWFDPTDPVNGLVPIYWDNPYFTRYESFETDTRNRVFGNVNLNYKISDWLNIMGRVGLDQYGELQEERQAVGSINIPGYSRFNRTYSEANFDLIANMDKNLSQDINFKALLGTNIRKQHTQSIDASTNGGLTVAGIYALNNSANPVNPPSEFDGKREVDGVFAGATFTWRDMVTLDATVRRDASSTLPEGSNVYYYPSVSGGFTFSKLLPAVNWLTYAKVRANYAQVGNDAPIYSVLDVYTITTPFGSQPTTTVPSTKNNPILKPERTSSAEIGLEMAFLKNRAGFDIAYYQAKTIDQILPLAVSTATGYSSKFLNAGTIDNRGIELTMFGTPIQNKDFSWTINLNWTRNRNKVVELFPGADNLVLATFQGGVSLNATLNQPYGTIRGSNFVYTNGQKTVDNDGYYIFSQTSNEVIGDPNPDWIGGINNTFKYKNIALSFLVDVRHGGDVFSLDMYYGMATGLYPETAGKNDLGSPSRNSLADGGGVILPGVYQDGKPNASRIANEYGTFGYVVIPSAGFVYDASYVKLREAVLTYSFPQKTISGLKYFKGIDISVIGRNLWIIHKNLPYSDPEETLSSGNLQGYQGGAYPTTRTIAFNLKLRF
ncbi:MAG: SusC/RagA family TonB-linked outer membrane protein [Bacteroidetes bacterium]|nr:MAG: SusC/RagA family TonB-linked outer membrane protein [Bacteroidota bacterium]